MSSGGASAGGASAGGASAGGASRPRVPFPPVVTSPHSEKTLYSLDPECPMNLKADCPIAQHQRYGGRALFKAWLKNLGVEFPDDASASELAKLIFTKTGCLPVQAKAKVDEYAEKTFKDAYTNASILFKNPDKTPCKMFRSTNLKHGTGPTAAKEIWKNGPCVQPHPNGRNLGGCGLNACENVRQVLAYGRRAREEAVWQNGVLYLTNEMNAGLRLVDDEFFTEDRKFDVLCVIQVEVWCVGTVPGSPNARNAPRCFIYYNPATGSGPTFHAPFYVIPWPECMLVHSQVTLVIPRPVIPRPMTTQPSSQNSVVPGGRIQAPSGHKFRMCIKSTRDGENRTFFQGSLVELDVTRYKLGWGLREWGIPKEDLAAKVKAMWTHQHTHFAFIEFVRETDNARFKDHLARQNLNDKKHKIFIWQLMLQNRAVAPNSNCEKWVQVYLKELNLIDASSVPSNNSAAAASVSASSVPSSNGAASGAPSNGAAAAGLGHGKEPAL